MRILILQDDIPPEARGGAGTVAFATAKGLAKTGNNVLVFAATQDRALVGRAVYEGIQIERVYSSYHPRWRAYVSLYNPSVLRRLRHVLAEFRPDIVHAHNVHTHISYAALAAAKRSGAKVFLTAHDVMLFHYGKLVECVGPAVVPCTVKRTYRVSPWQQIRRFKRRYNPLRNVVIKYSLRYVERIFAVSNALKEALAENGIGPVDVIYNSIDVGAWRVDPMAIERFRETHDLEGKKIVLFGGTLGEAKGGRQAILAMRQVAQEIPEAVLLIMGERNAYAEEMIALAREFGIAKCLIFTGWLAGEELKAAYAASDVLIAPSICFDTFGMVCLEAMAVGRPVVASCVGGMSEVVEEGVTGYLVPPYDVEGLAQKAGKLLSDDAHAHTMGTAGQARAQHLFSRDTQIQNLFSWYRKS